MIRKWKFMEHFYKSNIKNDEVYDPIMIPHIMIIDENGIIIFKDHPSKIINTQIDLNELRKDKEKKEEIKTTTKMLWNKIEPARIH